MYSNPLHIFVCFSLLTVPQASSENSAILGKNEQSATNEKEGCICYEDLWDPVCATNGQTYGNTCELNCARKSNPYIFGVCKGACPCCRVPFFNEPLPHEQVGFWGWDSKTGDVHQMSPPESPEETYAEIVSSEKERDYCTDRINNPNCFHILIYAPVCGSDNTTYSNSGELGCQQQLRPCLTQACEGPCPCCTGPCPDSNNWTKGNYALH